MKIHAIIFSTRKHPFASGFNLIEILITLAIISIFASISLPLYSHHVMTERRLEAKSMLIKLALAMEQYHIEHDRYEGATLTALHFSSLIAKNNYQLNIQSATDDAYQLNAKPIGEQAVRDTECGTLILDSKEQKTITGNGSREICW